MRREREREREDSSERTLSFFYAATKSPSEEHRGRRVGRARAGLSAGLEGEGGRQHSISFPKYVPEPDQTRPAGNGSSDCLSYGGHNTGSLCISLPKSEKTLRVSEGGRFLSLRKCVPKIC